MSLVTSAATRNKRWKITELEFPVHRLRAILKTHSVRAEKFFQMIFVAAEVTERVGVFQRELQRFNRAVKAHEADVARDLPRGAQDGERVGRRAEADIPDHEFAGVIFETFAQTELVDIKRLRFRDRADDRMKRLVIRKRTHGTGAVSQVDKLVAGIGLHGLVLREHGRTKRKTGNPAITRIAGPTQTTNTKIRAAPSPHPSRRGAWSSSLPFRRPCWRRGRSCL